MLAIIFGVGIVSVFVLAFLIDISVNLRRVNENIKKLAQTCNSSNKG